MQEVYFWTWVFLRCLFPAGLNPKFSRKDHKQFINMFLTINCDKGYGYRLSSLKILKLSQFSLSKMYTKYLQVT